MNHFTVSSLPLKDVIADLAKEMRTDFHENCSIFSIQVPKNLGSGEIFGIDFEDGLGLIEYDCQFKRDTKIEFSVDKIHPVKFLFCQEGTFEHGFKNESILHTIPQYKNAIVASSAHHGHLLHFKANEKTTLNSLELDRRKFQSKMSCNLSSLAKELQALFNDITAKETFYHEGYYSLQFAEILKEWSRFKENNFVRKINLESLSYKILALQIIQFEDDIRSEGKRTMLRLSELNQIKKAIHIINNNLENLPTISHIAYQVGLQPKKLQRGFQDLFNKTVNEYIKVKRLEVIRTLLSNSDYSINTIASMVGLKSQSYVSELFKKEYGISPSEFKQNMSTKRTQPVGNLQSDGNEP